MNNEHNQVPEMIFTTNILTEKEPIGILQLINTGGLSRYSAWKVLQLVHGDELSCSLPQYGIITVFSLSKDIEQFKQLFDQGCDMLRDEGIIDDEFEKASFKELNNILKKHKNTIIAFNPLDKTNKSVKKKKKKNSTPKNNN